MEDFIIKAENLSISYQVFRKSWSGTESLVAIFLHEHDAVVYCRDMNRKVVNILEKFLYRERVITE